MVGAPMLLTLGLMGIMAVMLAAGFGLRAWQDWLDTKRLRIDRDETDRHGGGPPDLVELRRRVRRLEFIAEGRSD